MPARTRLNPARAEVSRRANSRFAVWRGLRRRWPRPSARLVIVLLALLALPTGLDVARGVRDWFNRVLRPSPLAPLFTHEIAYWGQDIRRWAETYGVEPNLLATIMQIESCGHPTIASPAGAQGLFQVMPFHFEAGEDPLDPDTNARRGALFLKFCVDYTGGDVGLTLACYNGGPATTHNPNWSSETRRYYRWGTGIYADALVGKSHSDTLDAWLKAGGSALCTLAARELGL